MKRNTTRDFVVGLFVLGGLAAIAFLSFNLGNLSLGGGGGLQVYATFDEIGGLKNRAPVEVSGVKVGVVRSIRLDNLYRARVEMDLEADLELPLDTSASILTAGLLGDQYISLQLGGEEEIVASGEELSFTESAVILERLIGQFIHSGVGGDSEKE